MTVEPHQINFSHLIRACWQPLLHTAVESVGSMQNDFCELIPGPFSNSWAAPDPITADCDLPPPSNQPMKDQFQVLLIDKDSMTGASSCRTIMTNYVFFSPPLRELSAISGTLNHNWASVCSALSTEIKTRHFWQNFLSVGDFMRLEAGFEVVKQIITKDTDADVFESLHLTLPRSELVGTTLLSHLQQKFSWFF